jgi:CDP-diacylglycerol---serine O-phosphatidyltransferase
LVVFNNLLLRKFDMSNGLSEVRAKTRRLRQLGMHIYVLPNLITTMNLFSGFFAIIQSIKGEYRQAAYAIVAAAVFDLLDGRVARMTHSMSKFGAEYDSLCDLVSFGLAPGILLYQWALQPFGRVGWLASFMFAACGALRLARFNVQAGVVEKNYFQGLPIPMAGGIVASSVLAFQDMEWEAQKSPVLLLMAFTLAIVMVSTFRYRSFKDLDLRHRVPFSYLVAGLIVIVMIAVWPEVMLFLVFATYAVLGAIFGILRLGKPMQPAASAPLASDGDDLYDDSEGHGD